MARRGRGSQFHVDHCGFDKGLLHFLQHTTRTCMADGVLVTPPDPVKCLQFFYTTSPGCGLLCRPDWQMDPADLTAYGQQICSWNKEDLHWLT